jgi:hypothetical protein
MGLGCSQLIHRGFMSPLTKNMAYGDLIQLNTN